MSAAPPARYVMSGLDDIDDDDEPMQQQPTQPPAPAPAAAADQAKATEEQPHTVESYGGAVGVIEPPPDLKVIIDRTADFVRRVGPQFEGEIIQRNKGKKQFQFLENPSSPYHAYYKQRVKYGAEGPPPSEAGAAANVPLPQAAVKEEEEEKKVEEDKPKVLTLTERLKAYVKAAEEADPKKVQEALEKKEGEAGTSTSSSAAPSSSTSGHIHPSRQAPSSSPSPSVPRTAASSPPSFSFRLKHPTHYSAVDIDILKLTALYLSRNGSEFLQGLQRREQRNPHFDFLKPQHPLFVFFQQVVEAYKRILIPSSALKEQLELEGRIRSREEQWQELLVEAALKKKRDAELAASKASAEVEQASMASIDWRDFVVVETISFRDEDDQYLPTPCHTVEEMAAMLAAQTLVENNAAAGGAEGEGEMDMDEDMDMDMETDEARPAPAAAAAAPAASEADEVNRLIRSTVVVPDEDEQLEIRHETSEESAPKSRQAVFQKCIVCGDEIAIDDLAEHMRIELLDPRWKEQKQALLDKQRESSLASDSIVSANLARLARRVIGSEGNKQQDQLAELRARQQAAKDAALLFGPDSVQAREAAARAGEILPPPPPPKPQATPAKQAAPIGPTGPSASPPAAPAAAAAPSPSPPAAAASTPAPPPPPAAAAARPAPPHHQMPGAPGMHPMRMMPPYGAPGMAPYPPPHHGYGAPPPFPGVMPPPPHLAAAPGRPSPSPPVPSPAPAPVPPPAAAPAHPAPLIPASEQPATKKQRVSAADLPASLKVKLIPEAEFLATHDPSLTLRVSVPNDPSSPFNFSGQSLEVSAQLTDSVLSLKEKLSALLANMPTNKMKLQFSASGGGGSHLNKDELTLAAYNVPNGATLTVGIKERGGKKK